MLRIMRTFDQIYLVFWIFIKIFSGKKPHEDPHALIRP